MVSEMNDFCGTYLSFKEQKRACKGSNRADFAVSLAQRHPQDTKGDAV